AFEARARDEKTGVPYPLTPEDWAGKQQAQRMRHAGKATITRGADGAAKTVEGWVEIDRQKLTEALETSPVSPFAPSITPKKHSKGGRPFGPYHSSLMAALVHIHKDIIPLNSGETGALKKIRECAKTYMKNRTVRGVPTSRSALEDAIKKMIPEAIKK